MVLLQEINRIKEIMFLFEDKGEGIGKSNLFKDFDLDQFKNEPPPKDNSKKTKEELEFISKIELDKRFVQSRDDIGANFFDFLDSKDIDYNKKLLKKIKNDSVDVIQTLKKHYKRPRPFTSVTKKNPSTFGPYPPASFAGKQHIVVPTNFTLSFIFLIKYVDQWVS